jgi:hypothetical protein
MRSSRPATADKIPEDILLEIFHSIREMFGPTSHESELSWNGRNGWFTLAHVCRKWRFVVLVSSSRLQLRLFFMSCRPLRSIVLKQLPPLPIIIDYSRPGVWTLLEENRVVATLRSYPDRVLGIVISGWNYNLDGVCKATKCSFPALESFNLFAAGEPVDDSQAKFAFPSSMLMGSASSLRRLELRNVKFAPLSRLLSATTNLVHLTLDVETIKAPSPALSLFDHLRGMPYLRTVELKVSPRSGYSGTSDTESETHSQTENIFPLLNLSHLHFEGPKACFETLVARLSAPFLQDLKLSFQDRFRSDHHLPHLSRFIRDIEGHFTAVQVRLTEEDFEIDILPQSRSSDEPLRRIFVRDVGRSGVLTGDALHAKLLAVKELLFDSQYCTLQDGVKWISSNSPPWLGFLEKFHNVKTLRVGPGLVLDVGRLLSQNSGKFVLDLLPALEEIGLGLAVGPEVKPISDTKCEGVLAAFKPFATARQQAGRPVKIFWDADSVPLL